MKPNPFRYEKPANLQDALALLDQHGDDAKVIAGGQSLMPSMNMRFAAPEVLVDLNGIDELKQITETDSTLTIGALATHAAIMASDVAGRAVPLLHMAVPNIAHPTIRNRGTMGGSCANADPAAEWPACTVAADATFVIAGARWHTALARRRFFPGHI